MSKRAPKLQFTDEELAVPEVSKAAKKAANQEAQRAARQAERQEELPADKP